MRLRTLIALTAVLLFSSNVQADQNDERLGSLFEQLQTVSTPEGARSIEARIWTIWYEHPDNAVELLLRQGQSAMRRQDFDAALRSFDQVVLIDPQFAEGWNARATLNYYSGQYERSLFDIDKTLQLEPRHFGALSGRGLVYTAMEQLDLALEAFEETLTVNPHSRGAKLNAEAIRKVIQDREI